MEEIVDHQPWTESRIVSILADLALSHYCELLVSGEMDIITKITLST